MGSILLAPPGQVLRTAAQNHEHHKHPDIQLDQYQLGEVFPPRDVLHVVDPLLVDQIVTAELPEIISYSSVDNPLLQVLIGVKSEIFCLAIDPVKLDERTPILDLEESLPLLVLG